MPLPPDLDDNDLVDLELKAQRGALTADEQLDLVLWVRGRLEDERDDA